MTQFWAYYGVEMAAILSSSDITRLQRAMAQVRDESFFSTFRNLLRARMLMDTFLIINFTKDGTPQPVRTWIKDADLAQKYPELYVEGAYRLDPFFQHRHRIGQGGLYRLSEIAPDRFFSGDYYLQYYKETRIVDEVGLLVPLSDGAIGHLSFSRQEDLGSFKRKELNCLRHYAPILLELLRQHCEHRLIQTTAPAAAEPTGRLDDLIRSHIDAAHGVRLTRREAQMAGLIVQGHSNLSAALNLGISRETAKVHRRNIYRKLTISSQRELFAQLADLF